MGTRARVVIAGASGFIGQCLTEALLPDYDIIGLARAIKPSTAGLEWRVCDLFSLLQAEKALAGADYAFYLVHSMMPHARLTQGSFRDMDLILADNFARAAATAGIKQIIYLGGIIPDGKDLSEHLQSRYEVEKTLASHGVPVTNVRASLIVGPRGSSFQIIEKLVKRLPILVCPGWTRSMTQPIAVDDVITLLRSCIGNPEVYHRAFDIGGPDVLSYLTLLRLTAKAMGLRRWILSVPLEYTRLSRFWVSMITETPRELVDPLVESLRHPMVTHNRLLQDQIGQPGMPIETAINTALAYKQDLQARPEAKPQVRTKYTQSLQLTDGLRAHEHFNDVRSVQRLPLPHGKNAVWVAEKYTIWLPRFMYPLVIVEVDTERTCYFYLKFLKKPLLVLSYSTERSTPDRTLFYVTGGLLADTRSPLRGRLEFREVLNGQYVLAAIHDFTPRLPWFIYNRTQAIAHLFVMQGFQRYLADVDVAY